MRNLLDSRNNIYEIITRQGIAPRERVVRALATGEVLLHWGGFNLECHSSRRKALEKFAYHSTYFTAGQSSSADSIWAALFFRSQWDAACKLYGNEPWDEADSASIAMTKSLAKIASYARENKFSPAEVEDMFNVGMAAFLAFRARAT